MTKTRTAAAALLPALALLAAASAGRAATYTVAGYTWDTANSFTAATGTFDSNSNATPFPALDGAGEGDLTIGRLLGTSGSLKRRVAVGSNGLRHAITLTLPSGSTLPNAGAGEDLVLYEQGDPSKPEAYAVAVRVAGQSAFTPFRYEIWDTEQLNGAVSYLATAFDLTSFGLGPADAIDAIQVRNLTDTTTSTGFVDYVPTGGFGEVLTVAGTDPSLAPAGYVLPIGYNATKDGLFPADEHDPDMVYVGVLNALTPIPEPMVAATAGVLLGGTLLRRRRAV